MSVYKLSKLEEELNMYWKDTEKERKLTHTTNMYQRNVNKKKGGDKRRWLKRQI